MGQFETIPSKQTLSGVVFSEGTNIKTIFIIDRKTMTLLASGHPNENGDWKISCPLREDGQIIAMCRDEGTQYNIDVYDRVGLCTDNFSSSLYHDNLILVAQ